MKKMAIALLWAAAMCAAHADGLDVNKLAELRAKALEANELIAKGQSIKAARISKYIDSVFSPMVKPGTILQFKKMTRVMDRHNPEIYSIREFKQEGTPIKIHFRFYHEDDVHAGYFKKHDLTPSKEVEIFEENMVGPTGTIKIVEMLGKTYEICESDKILTIYCKILKIK